MLVPRWGPHADAAKDRHNLTESQIAHTWVHGYAEQTHDGCWRLVGEEITLVLNEAGNFIITMYPNKHNDRYLGKIAKNRQKMGHVRQKLFKGD